MSLNRIGAPIRRGIAIAMGARSRLDSLYRSDEGRADPDLWNGGGGRNTTTASVGRRAC